MPEIHEFWDPNEWEQYVYGLLQDRHGPLKVHKVPARHQGDHGLDYYSLEDQAAYQCYAVQEPCEIADRAEKQKSKITIDLGKFCKNQKELSALFGATKIARWVLVVPIHDSSQVNAHNSRKSSQIKALNLSYVAQNFEVMIQDLGSFDTSSRAMRRTIRDTSIIPSLPASADQVQEWSKASENLIATLRHKLSKRSGADEDALGRSVSECIGWFLERENSLESLRQAFPELHEALVRAISRQGQRLELYGPPPSGSAHQILRNELEALVAALKEVPNIDDASAQSLAVGTIAEWLMRCPLDFPPYDHAG